MSDRGTVTDERARLRELLTLLAHGHSEGNQPQIRHRCEHRGCGQVWPCDTSRRVAEALALLDAQLCVVWADIEALLAEFDARKTSTHMEDRLAAALRETAHAQSCEAWRGDELERELAEAKVAEPHEPVVITLSRDEAERFRDAIVDARPAPSEPYNIVDAMLDEESTEAYVERRRAEMAASEDTARLDGWIALIENGKEPDLWKNTTGDWYSLWNGKDTALTPYTTARGAMDAAIDAARAQPEPHPDAGTAAAQEEYLAGCEKDKLRLDWLEEVRSGWVNARDDLLRTPTSETLREAIDAARAKGEG